MLVLYVVLVDSDFRTIITIEPVFGGYPNHSLGIFVDVVDKAAGQMLVCCE